MRTGINQLAPSDLGLTHSSIGLAGKEDQRLRLPKFKKFIALLNTCDKLPNRGQTAKMCDWKSNSTMTYAIRYARALGYELDVTRFNITIINRPNPFPHEFITLLDSPNSTHDTQLKLHDAPNSTHTKLPKPELNNSRVFGDNIIISKGQYSVLKIDVDTLYNEYSVLVDLFNGV